MPRVHIPCVLGSREKCPVGLLTGHPEGDFTEALRPAPDPDECHCGQRQVLHILHALPCPQNFRKKLPCRGESSHSARVSRTRTPPGSGPRREPVGRGRGRGQKCVPRGPGGSAAALALGGFC